ncbi:hypothetical protein [Aeromicrobium wangtongii]|uniref:hypothetical protein n=1 Tax=Aeromicrobium wangtongii TaxID=2969247 RepID=UPI002017330C|nr:hypothetical protein [Aeromicrobium wangtongii]MCL3819330.1 hypothetical protein [Aeromicrobium wangtongii]
MKYILLALAAVVGVVLVGAAGLVLVDGNDSSADPAGVGDRAGTLRSAVDVAVDDPSVQVTGPLLVVNRDGSAALGASVENRTDVEVALMGVLVQVDRSPLAVNGTPWALPVPAGQRARVGAASDAGGFVLPKGVVPGAHAEVQFLFDDGSCVLADVRAVARTDRHRQIFPKTGRPIGPVTTARAPAGAPSCAPG